jgi:hypothetical protein
MKNRKSIFGVIAAALALSAITFFTHQPLDTNSNELQGLVIHCTATPENRDVSAEQIGSYFTRPVEKGGRGWKQEGYHDIIEKSGKVVNRVPMDDDAIISPVEIANGAKGFNKVVKHVAYIGGTDVNRKPKNTLTPEQDSSLKRYVFEFLELYPEAYILGHNQLSAKACPSFDVIEKMREYGIPEANIYKYRHRGKNIQLLDDTDADGDISGPNIMHAAILPKAISLHSPVRYNNAYQYQRNDTRHSGVFASGFGSNPSLARMRFAG